MDDELFDAVRSEACAEGRQADRARRIADLIRLRTRRRWIGIYRVEADRVVNLGWSGPGPPAYPRFPVDRGLTSAVIDSRTTVVSNDVASDPRYLAALQSTGSELIVPVLIAGQVVGTLDVEDGRQRAFDEDDRVIFERLAAALRDLYIP